MTRRKEKGYQSCVDYIEDLPKFTKKHSLDICGQLHKKLSIEPMTQTVIHVAGTNGKGSVSIYMEAMLLSMGNTVGTFVSPHLLTMRERIRIGGEPISETLFCEIFQEIYTLSQEAEKEGISHPTYFEFLFLMSELAFAREKVAYSIVEVGIGGRLDATNCMPKVSLSIITSIGLDHCDLLGDSIEKIAREKAGIIRENTMVIFDGRDARSTKVIAEIASEKQAPFVAVQSTDAKEVRFYRKNLAFSRKNMYDSFDTWEMKGQGLYQVSNFLLAIRAIEHLAEKEQVKVDYEALVGVVKNVSWAGRMEEVATDIILDGAHNEEAIRVLMDSIAEKQKVQERKMTFLVSIGSEKDARKMFEVIASYFPDTRCIVTALQDKRRMESNQLKKIANHYLSGEVIEVKNVRQAFLLACAMLQKDEMLYCFGSLYLVGEIKQVLVEEDLC